MKLKDKINYKRVEKLVARLDDTKVRRFIELEEQNKIARQEKARLDKDELQESYKKKYDDLVKKQKEIHDKYEEEISIVNEQIDELNEKLAVRMETIDIKLDDELRESDKTIKLLKESGILEVA